MRKDSKTIEYIVREGLSELGDIRATTAKTIISGKSVFSKKGYVHWGLGVGYDKSSGLYGVGKKRTIVKEQFPNTPKPPYNLTFKLDPKGKILVKQSRGGFVTLSQPGSSLKHRRIGLLCCLIPDEWEGKRITRIVKEIR